MLPLTKPADGYLRLSFNGAAGVVGVSTQSWDLTALPEYVRADPQFKRSLLIFARPLTAGLMDVDAAVAFSPAVGTPAELVLTVTAGALVDELTLDVWYLHSILGAVSDASKLYFIPPPGGGGGAVTSVFARVGAVVAALGDYTSSLVTNSSGVAGASVTDALNTLAATIVPAPVSSVFGRIGAVGAAAGDYTSTLITNASGVAGASVTDALNTLAAAIVASVATKELWISVETSTNYPGFNYRDRGIGGTGNFNFNFPVPRDFIAITALELIGAPNADFSGAGNVGIFNLASDYGANLESVGNHTEASLGETVVGLQDAFFTLDLSPVFSALAAGDRCGVNVDNDSDIGTTINWMWIRLRYT